MGLSHSRNLAARAGRWSARNRRAAILGWVAFVVLATVLGSLVGQRDLAAPASGNGEHVLVQGSHTDAAVRDVVARLQRLTGVSGVERRASEDGRSTAVSFKLGERQVDASLAAVAAVQKAHPGVRVEQFGEASAAKALAAQDAKDSKNAERISVALMLIILAVAFGALVVAGVPLVLGITAVVAAVGLLGPISQLYALPSDVAELMVIIGLAVGVDYAMFYSRRMLEERDRGHSATAAVEIAAATSGRAVLISGATVIAAMGGLLFAGDAIFIGFGIGTMLVVAVAVAGSMTFLPAMLSFLGEKGWLQKGRVPYVNKGRESRLWGAILERTLKRPLLSALIAGGLLVALAIPALGMQFKNPGYDGYSRDQAIIQTYDRLQQAFPHTEVAVTGEQEFTDSMLAHAPIVLLFVGGLTFILLLVAFRSIVVPIKAIALNLLSVGAALGVLVLVFQDGHGESLLDFHSVGGVAPVIPLFLFVILFGLSMDYHVFILGRIRELVDGGMRTDDAVAHGIKSTAGVVTSAALIMVAVFGAFALSSDQMAKQIGIGLATAILIDATVIRAILLPASMKLLGARNWYLPERLRRLPSLAHAPA